MVFKRPLSIPSTTIDDNPAFTKSKFCKVCGDEARIINYGALSCQSCKTFFRRIGFRPNVCFFLRIFSMNIIYSIFCFQ
jgi:hypothetical protein